MKWPWVSRKYTEVLERENAVLHQQVEKLLELVQMGANLQNKSVSVEEDPVVQFSTPFDKIEKKWDTAGPKSRDSKFRVRV